MLFNSTFPHFTYIPMPWLSSTPPKQRSEINLNYFISIACNLKAKSTLYGILSRTKVCQPSYMTYSHLRPCTFIIYSQRIPTTIYTVIPMLI
jgi:hypothetical protein